MYYEVDQMHLFIQLACFDYTCLRKKGFSLQLLATLLLTDPSGSYSLLGDNVCTGAPTHL